MRIIGIDPGLTHTGWGIIEQKGSRLSAVSCGRISSPASLSQAARLARIHAELSELLEKHQPQAAAVEQVFVNANPKSSLTLGLARGVALAALAGFGLEVAEYAPNSIKKSVTGQGKADKAQVQAMVRVLLPGLGAASADAADALAVAICHAHHGRQSRHAD